MKRPIVHRRGLILLAGTLLVLAGIAWGAAYHPYSRAVQAAAVVTTTPSAAFASAPAPVAVATPATPRTTPEHATVSSAPNAGQAGMRIFRDPETGEIGPPTGDQAAVLARESGEQTDVQLPVHRMANGGWEMVNDGRIVDAMVLTIDKDGHRTFSCIDNVANEKVAFQKAQQTAPAPTREDR